MPTNPTTLTTPELTERIAFLRLAYRGALLHGALGRANRIQSELTWHEGELESR